MTCIVGLIDKKTVYMGADSAGVGNLNLRVRKDLKVFKNGKFLMGCTTSFRMIQLLKYQFIPPKHPPSLNTDKYMVTKFIDAVRKCFKNGGFAKSENDEEKGGTWLVGYKGRLFRIEDDYQVAENIFPFDSCGCGENYAMGSLYSTNGRIKDPQKRIILALEAAQEFSAGVKGPFYIKT